MMTWWRTHWRLGLALVAVGLGFILVTVLYIARKTKEAEELKRQLELMQTTLKVAGLEADKKAREVELKVNAEKAAEVDKAIVEAKKNAVAVITKVDNMTDEDVIKEFKKLGY